MSRGKPGRSTPRRPVAKIDRLPPGGARAVKAARALERWVVAEVRWAVASERFSVSRPAALLDELRHFLAVYDPTFERKTFGRKGRR